MILRGALGRTWNAYSGFAERLGFAPEKIPAEKIDAHTVAKTIVSSIVGC